MRLKEYIKYLKKLEKNHKDDELWYAEDEEGNGFKPVYFGPSVKYIPKDIKGSIDCMDMKDEKEPGYEQEVIVIN